MTDTWLVPDQLFDGEDLRADMALKVRDGTVAAVVPRAEAQASARPVEGIVAPGFLDLQVNGGGGVLLNETPSAQAMQDIAAVHRRFGTVGILPTVITDAPEVLASAVEAAIEARGRRGILGLHIEGPHIAQSRRGTHAAGHVRPMDDVTLNHVRRLRDAEVAVMITLAPEAASEAQISVLAEMGAVVSIGHTDATAEMTRAALAAGARCATHLFNAMSPMLNRSPGVVGAIINSDAYAGLIVDGIHVADEMIGLAIRARPAADRMFLVSDAMPTVGGPESFRLYGQDVHLERDRLVNAQGTLAGAHLTQAQGVHRLVNVIGIDAAAALRMAISIPARLMGLDPLAVPVGRHVSDLVRLSPSLDFLGPVCEP